MGVVFFATALTMTVVHIRVPDQESYPPLPDVVLDNVPLIPKAFEAAEYIAMILMWIFIGVLVMHKYRMVVIRRFCVIMGSVFLLRCVTMFVTSLSVPGLHLKCHRILENGTDFDSVLSHAWDITAGLGLSVNDVRTCGDYMFSGHTIVLTMLNYAINEYTPRHWRGTHIMMWVSNVFGMFLILAAHEHYTIDVIIAFYITSRMFLYYHSIANSSPRSGAEETHHFDFLVFAYMEEEISGVVPNEYEYPWEFFSRIRRWSSKLYPKSKAIGPLKKQQQPRTPNLPKKF